MIYNLLILSVAIFIVAHLLPGIRIRGFWTAVVVALVYSTINYLTGWLFVLLAFPLMIVTFGLFKFVINAFLLWITDKLMEDFEINSIGTTLVAACLITLVDFFLHKIF